VALGEVASAEVASGEAKTRPGSEATKTLGSVSRCSPSHEEKSTKRPVSKLKHDEMRHTIKTAEKALHQIIGTSSKDNADGDGNATRSGKSQNVHCA